MRSAKNLWTRLYSSGLILFTKLQEAWLVWRISPSTSKPLLTMGQDWKRAFKLMWSKEEAGRTRVKSKMETISYQSFLTTTTSLIPWLQMRLLISSRLQHSPPSSPQHRPALDYSRTGMPYKRSGKSSTRSQAKHLLVSRISTLTRLSPWVQSWL